MNKRAKLYLELIIPGTTLGPVRREVPSMEEWSTTLHNWIRDYEAWPGMTHGAVIRCIAEDAEADD